MRITVLTSNKYVHVLPAFAYCFNKCWRPNPDVKVVRYDVRPPALPDNFLQHAIGKQADYTWSSGLIHYLTFDCGEPFLLLMLEDYLLHEDVNVEAIAKLWECMVADPTIAKTDLSGDLAIRGAFPISEMLCEATEVTPYIASLQAAIWRRDVLLNTLETPDNPWQFERRRVKGRVLGVREPLLRYVNGIGGEGRNPEAWDRRKFPVTLWNELSAKGLVW